MRSAKASKSRLRVALTDKISDRETFMKGIDYSYYYEQEDWRHPFVISHFSRKVGCGLSLLLFSLAWTMVQTRLKSD